MAADKRDGAENNHENRQIKRYGCIRIHLVYSFPGYQGFLPGFVAFQMSRQTVVNTIPATSWKTIS